ncbi:hypothetical protein DV515_00004917 [Chloebia gouldiae]|uniref:Uncharacterized protein n=1 Tax=Chloebia gouldiae TaxID=44316 RepID=A0A3L8SQ65_CHLGU|nr:hypothetical protein DV515_00004917 [Chloebia gouldiae]
MYTNNGRRREQMIAAYEQKSTAHPHSEKLRLWQLGSSAQGMGMCQSSSCGRKLARPCTVTLWMQAVPPAFSLSLKQGDIGKTAGPYVTTSLREQQCSTQHWQHTEHPLLQQQCHLTRGHSRGAAQDCVGTSHSSFLTLQLQHLICFLIVLAASGLVQELGLADFQGCHAPSVPRGRGEQLTFLSPLLICRLTRCGQR